jgi:hypothetical protein
MRIAPLLALLALAACNTPAPKPVPAPPAAPVAVPQPQSTGCLEIARIREARVIDDRTIDFAMNDGRTVRSAMAETCPSLASEKQFTYSTSLTRLCPADSITVVNQAGGPRLGASCKLGAMTPLP